MMVTLKTSVPKV